MLIRRRFLNRRQIKSSEGELIWELENSYSLSPKLSSLYNLNILISLPDLNPHLVLLPRLLFFLSLFILELFAHILLMPLYLRSSYLTLVLPFSSPSSRLLFRFALLSWLLLLRFVLPLDYNFLVNILLLSSFVDLTDLTP